MTNRPNANDPEYQFWDTAKICVAGGDGGNGCVSFRREKGQARGGPNGGKGGSGGSVYLQASRTIQTLLNCRQQVHVRARNGKNGQGKSRNGVSGDDLFIHVPLGTIVRDLKTQLFAGELRRDGDKLLVAKGGRGGRGNAAFQTNRRTAPKLAERGESGAQRWLELELQLLAQVGFLGMPNAGKSTLLAASSAAKPKIASYPFTTLVPNLGVCTINKDAAEGLVLCDIPGLIPGAARGAGMGSMFLRHVQRCRVLLHVVDGTSADPVADFHAIQTELQEYDPIVLAHKPQVVVLNKVDVSEVRERETALLEALKVAAGHSRVMSISAATMLRVPDLFGRLSKLVAAEEAAAIDDGELDGLPSSRAAVEIDLSKAGLDYPPDDFTIQSDPSYPNQWRLVGNYVESVARMTHWEYPEALERFGRQLQALGIADALVQKGAVDGDLIMIDKFDFDFSPGMTNPYVPAELLEADERLMNGGKPSSLRVITEADEAAWRPFPEGGFFDVDAKEFEGFANDDLDDSEDGFASRGAWDNLLMVDADDDFADKAFESGEFEDDEVWTA